MASSTRQKFEGVVIERIVHEIFIGGKSNGWQLVLEEMHVMIIDLHPTFWIAWFYQPLIGNQPLSGVTLSHWLLTNVISSYLPCIAMYEGGPMCTFTCGLIHTTWSLQTKPMLLLSTSSLYWPGLAFKWLCLTMCLDHAHKHFKVSLRWLSEDKHRIWRFQFICNI